MEKPQQQTLTLAERIALKVQQDIEAKAQQLSIQRTKQFVTRQELVDRVYTHRMEFEAELCIKHNLRFFHFCVTFGHDTALSKDYWPQLESSDKEVFYDYLLTKGRADGFKGRLFQHGKMFSDSDIPTGPYAIEFTVINWIRETGRDALEIETGRSSSAN